MTRTTKIINLSIVCYGLTLVGTLLVGGIGVHMGREGGAVDSTMGPLLAMLLFYQVALFVGTFALGLALGRDWYSS